MSEKIYTMVLESVINYMTSPSRTEIWALQDHNLNIPDNRDVSLSYMEMIVFL